MIKKILLLIVFFYILAISQTSFFIHWKIIPNLILIAVILINLFESPKEDSGLFAALWAGLFWDVFSQSPFGFYTLILLMVALFIKLIFKKYVRIPSLKGV